MQHWEKVGPVTVYRGLDGQTFKYESLNEAIIAFESVIPKLKYGRVAYYDDGGIWGRIGDPIVVEDEHGLIIPIWRLMVAYHARKSAPVKEYRLLGGRGGRWFWSSHEATGEKHRPTAPGFFFRTVYMGRRKRIEIPVRFRYDPVPYVHNYRRGGPCKSNKRVHQEVSIAGLIEYDDEMKEYGIRPRGRRTRSQLPDSRDDRHRIKQRSWKEQRKTQWKGN